MKSAGSCHKIIEVIQSSLARHAQTLPENSEALGLLYSHRVGAATAVLTALSSSGYIICQASDAAGGDAVSRKSALQSDDGADAHKGPHGNVLRGFAARYPGNPLAEKLKLAATWVDNLNAKLRQLEEAQADTANEDAR
jgi:hypothetical protein